jgi:RNA polymerase sigma-70 factor (ECF subfamily)
MDCVAAGDESALSELYDRFAGRLTALSLRILANPGDAEEVLQEVFVYVWKNAASYDPARASVSTWLGLITRSRSLDLIRHRNFLRRTRDDYRNEADTVDRGTEGYGRTLDEQRAQRVREALGILPAEQRRVLELAYYGGLSQSQISRRTDIPLGTVKTRTLLAMRKLREELDGELRQLM